MLPLKVMIPGFPGWIKTIVRLVRQLSKYRFTIKSSNELEKFMRALSQTMDGILITDESNTIEFANEAWANMHGYTLEEIQDKSISLFHVPGQAHPLEAHNGELMHVKKDGSLFPVWETVSIFKDSTGVVTGKIWIGRDHTNQKRAEELIVSYSKQLVDHNFELEQSNRELDDFAYIASHDLKEPLRGIHNYAAFLLEDHKDKLDDEGKRKVKILIEQTQHMEALIDSLLYYSRVGQKQLAIVKTDINDLVNEAIGSLRINIEQENVDIKVETPLPKVECDRVRFAEVLRNLISNAIKYNDKPRKEIRIGSIQKPGINEPIIYVRDNGIGIQEKHHESIFKIFKRLHGKTKYGGGTGAGLTIVKKIVERHGGRVWVESEANQGTTFYFTIGQSTQLLQNVS